MGDEQEFRAAVREALRAAAATPAPGEAPGRAALRRLGGAGLLARCVLPEAERAGRTVPLDFPAFAVLVEELAGAGDFGVALSVGLHVATFVPLVVRLGGEPLRPLAERAVRGEALGALAMTDAGAAGSDPLAMTTTIRTADGGIVLGGHKTYVTNVPGADAAVVFAAREGAAAFARISAVLVPTDRPGVRVVPRDMAVMRSAAVGDLLLDGVALGSEHVLGRPGRGLQYFLEHIGVERLMGGIWAGAVAARCLADAQRDAARRDVGGEPLWRKGAVRQRLAAAAVRAELLDAVVRRALDRAAATGSVDPYDAAVVKAAVAPAMEEVVGTCLQLQGARGLERGSPLLGLLADFRAFGVAGGTTETMLDVVADALEQRAARRDAGAR